MPIVSVRHHDDEDTLFNTDCTAGSLMAALTELANSNTSSRNSTGQPGVRYRTVELLPLTFVMDLANNGKVASALCPHRPPLATCAAGVGAADDAAATTVITESTKTGNVGGTRNASSFSASSTTAALTALIHNVPFSGLLQAPVQQLASEVLITTLPTAGGASTGSAGHGHGNVAAGSASSLMNAYVLIGCRETVLPQSSAVLAGASTVAPVIQRPSATMYPSATAGGASSAARMLKQQQQQQQSISQSSSLSHGTGAVVAWPPPADGTTLSAQTISQLLHQVQTATEAPIPSSTMSADASSAVATAAEVAQLLMSSSSSAATSPKSRQPFRYVMLPTSTAGAAGSPGTHDEEQPDVVRARKLFVVSIEEEENALLQRVAAAESRGEGAATAANANGSAAAAATSKNTTSSNNNTSQSDRRTRSSSSKRASSAGPHSLDRDHCDADDSDPINLVGKAPVVSGASVPLSEAATRMLHANTAASGTGTTASVSVNMQACSVTVVKGGGSGGAGSSSTANASPSGGKPTGRPSHVLERVEAFDILWRGPQSEHEVLRAFLQEYLRTLKRQFDALQSSATAESGAAGRLSTAGQGKARKR